MSVEEAGTAELLLLASLIFTSKFSNLLGCKMPAWTIINDEKGEE